MYQSEEFSDSRQARLRGTRPRGARRDVQRNRLKLGLFGANCSSGRAVTMVPERWSGSWADCVALAQMADEAGIEFMLPIGALEGLWRRYRLSGRDVRDRDLGLRASSPRPGG